MGQEYKKDVNVESTVNFNTQPSYVDDMESTLKWGLGTKTNTSGAITLDNTIAFQGSQSLLISTGGTSPVINDLITAVEYMPIGPNKYQEVIYTFRSDANYNNQTILFETAINSNSTQHRAGIQLDTAASTIKYENSGGGFTDITTSDFITLNGIWNRIRLVIDIENLQYKYMIIGRHVIDLSGIGLRSYGLGLSSYIISYITLTTQTAYEATMHVDSVISRNLSQV